MDHAIWNDVKAKFIYEHETAPLLLKGFICFYIHGLWSDMMRPLLLQYSKDHIPNLPWHSLILTETSLVWFPKEIFPHGAAFDNNTCANVLLWKSILDMYFSQFFQDEALTIQKTIEYGLGWFIDKQMMCLSMETDIAPRISGIKNI